MAYAPNQNWNQIKARMRHENSEWLRSLSIDERLTIMEDLYLLASQIGGDSSEDDSLVLHRWQKKVALRNKVRDAFMQLGRWIDARPPKTDSG